jgi:hypothetical protein
MNANTDDTTSRRLTALNNGAAYDAIAQVGHMKDARAATTQAARRFHVAYARAYNHNRLRKLRELRDIKHAEGMIV